jgi:hypothetical protein
LLSLSLSSLSSLSCRSLFLSLYSGRDHFFTQELPSLLKKTATASREDRGRSRASTKTTINDRCICRDLRSAWCMEHLGRGWRRASIWPKICPENGRRLFHFGRDRALGSLGSSDRQMQTIDQCELTWWTKWHVTLFVLCVSFSFSLLVYSVTNAAGSHNWISFPASDEAFSRFLPSLVLYDHPTSKKNHLTAVQSSF